MPAEYVDSPAVDARPTCCSYLLLFGQHKASSDQQLFLIPDSQTGTDEELLVIGNLNTPQIAFFAILIIALVLFLTEWIRTDVVAVLVIIALYVTRVLKPEEALSGVSSEPAELRMTLQASGRALSETWVYHFQIP